MRCTVLCLLAATTLAVGGCGDDDKGTGPGGNSGPSSVIRVKVNGTLTEFSGQEVQARYDPVVDYTEIVAPAGEKFVGFTFPGNSPGSWDITNEDVEMEYFDGATGYYAHKSVSSQDVSASITVTHFGPVGETIEGTFSGTLAEEALRAAKSGEALSLTEGEFSIRRIPDDVGGIGGHF